VVDGALPVASKRLADAVHALVEPFPIWHGGICRLTPPLYVRLRAALRGNPGRSGRRLPASRLPCRGDILALLVDIDSTTAGWTKNADRTFRRLNVSPDTITRLRQLAADNYRPQDCSTLDGWTAALEAWTLTAAELLGDKPPEIPLRLPCPRCAKRYVYRLSAGENVRSWALRISEDGARCQSCRATWLPQEFEWLARLLGCPELPQ
jgi:hypothetical protein